MWQDKIFQLETYIEELEETSKEGSKGHGFRRNPSHLTTQLEADEAKPQLQDYAEHSPFFRRADAIELCKCVRITRHVSHPCLARTNREVY